MNKMNKRTWMTFFAYFTAWMAIIAALSFVAMKNVCASDTLWLPNLGQQQTGTIFTGHNAADVWVQGGNLTLLELATAANGAAPPALDKVIGGLGADGFIHTIKTDNSGNLQVGRTWSLLNTTDSVNAVQSGTWTVGINTAIPAGTNLIGSFRLTDGTNTAAVTVGSALKVDASATTQPISAAALPLPVGAATAAKQPALGTAGAASADVLTVQGVASMTPLKVDASATTQPVNGTVTANQGTANATPWNENISQVAGAVPSVTNGLPARITNGVSFVDPTQVRALTSADVVTANLKDGAGASVTVGQKLMATSLPVTIASDQTAIPTTVSSSKASVNITGSGGSGTVSTVITLTAPANTVGFVLQNLATSTANVRFIAGGTAGAASGIALAPGQDSGFIPSGANISLIAESGTQNYSYQWVSQ